MTEQEQINEMAEILEKAYIDARSNCGSLNQGFGMWYATALYNAGYRKVNLKELGEEVKQRFYYNFDEIIPSIMAKEIDEIIKRYEVGQ